MCCRSCGYAANVERARSKVAEITDETGPSTPESFPTPGVRTIAALADFDGGAPPDRQLKTMVMMLDGDMALAVVRGDHQLNVQKLQDASSANDVRPATSEETVERLGANPGSLGAVGVTGFRVFVDHALAGRTNMTTVANRDDWHLRGVRVERDLADAELVDLREITNGETCADCDDPLTGVRCIEVGHIFQLGTN